MTTKPAHQLRAGDVIAHDMAADGKAEVKGYEDRGDVIDVLIVFLPKRRMAGEPMLNTWVVYGRNDAVPLAAQNGAHAR